MRQPWRYPVLSCVVLGLLGFYSRVAQSDLATPAPGSLRISARPQMEGGRLWEALGKVFMMFYMRKHSQNIARFGPNQGQQSVKICGNHGNQAWWIATNDRCTAASL